jgi:hypothetical protein
MKRTSLEPGLLQVFRLFVGGRLVLLSLSLCAQLAQQEPRILRYPLPGIVGSALLLGYLSWPWLRDRMGKVYLPLALAAASAGPIIEYALTIGLRLMAGVPGADAIADVWQLILVLFIPLILVAWQYDLKSVIVFCAGTAMLDWMLLVPLTIMWRSRLETVAGLVFVRSLLFALVGYVVVRLMKGQRAQREALAQANDKLARYAATLEQLAISRERNRLARELHDTLAHTLSAVAVQLEATSALWDDDPATVTRGDARWPGRGPPRHPRPARDPARGPGPGAGDPPPGRVGHDAGRSGARLAGTRANQRPGTTSRTGHIPHRHRGADQRDAARQRPPLDSASRPGRRPYDADRFRRWVRL